MTVTSTSQPKVFLSELPPQEKPLTLRCRACKAVASYRVGRITIDPDFKQDVHASSPKEMMSSLAAVPWEKWVYFAGYFVCESCGSGGPWQFTARGKEEMALLMLLHLMEPKKSGIFVGTPTLFDGTAPRTGFEGVKHLKKLIEADPTSAFLWSRLGNCLVTAEEFDRSVAAFEKAVELDPADVESHHSLANGWFNDKKYERAAAHYQEVLRHCMAGTWRREDLKPILVQEAIETLVKIHRRTGGKFGTPAKPSKIDEFADRPDLAGVNLRGFDLGDPYDVDRLVLIFLDGPNAKVQNTYERWEDGTAREPAPKQRIGRNDPCLCGSGRKFKHCCMRK